MSTSDERHASPQHDPRGAPRPGAPRSSYFRLFTQALNIAGTILILVMALAVNADVFGRNAFNRPIPGVIEFIGLSIVAVVFLQMANTLHEDRHVSNDVLIRFLAEARPRAAAAVYAAFNLIGAALMLIIVIYVWPIFQQSYTSGYYAGTANVVEIPIWPFQAVVLLGAATTAIQFVLHTVRGLSQALGWSRP